MARTMRRGPWWRLLYDASLHPERFGKQMGSGKRAAFRYRDGKTSDAVSYVGGPKPELITDGACCSVATRRSRNRIRRIADRGAIREGLRDYVD